MPDRIPVRHDPERRGIPGAASRRAGQHPLLLPDRGADRVGTGAIAAAVREIDTIYTADIRPTQSYEISVEAEGSVQDSLLTYVITRSSYTGGAHGIYETEYHTYSLAKGYEITTADLFTEEQAERLDELILRKLCRQYGARNEEELAAQGFFPEQIGATENFRIAPEGIVFCYNPYDIGCYALGAVEVTVSREELDER